MSTPTLKRHNHRVHPCTLDKKEELLHILLAKNEGKKIVVVTSEVSELTSEQTNVSIVSDKELYNTPELRCELLISYDLPQQAIVYMSRISKSDSHALILLDVIEEKLLHPIETLNGRTIMQESIEGFSPERIEKTAQPIKKDSDPREDRKRAFLGTDEKPKREKKENKFLGKDEKGKSKFSGKSGERNHRYDGTPKGKGPKLTGKKISIKGKSKNED